VQNKKELFYDKNKNILIIPVANVVVTACSSTTFV
jgi:hypothetical protein